MKLERDGWDLVRPSLPTELLEDARERLFTAGEAGTRFLLKHTTVRRLAVLLRDFLAETGVLPKDGIAIQAIAFDKTAGANWKVPWHQDLMFPVAEDSTWDQRSLKDGVVYARPPLEVLQGLLAARLHLDPCGEDNGPLRLASGSHRFGLIPSREAADRARDCGETSCLAEEGEVLLMRPLTLHASSQAKSPQHRRVLHFVFDGKDPSLVEDWIGVVG